jgi:phenylacetaldehyde dehydrogenase
MNAVLDTGTRTAGRAGIGDTEMNADILESIMPASAAARAALQSPQSWRMLIGGEWHDGAGVMDAIDPATGRVIARFPDAGAADVDAAVAAARTAFPGWAATLPAERAAILLRIADLLEAHIDELAELETLDQGKPLYVGRWAEIPGAIAQFRFFAGQAMAIEGRTITPSINYQPAGKQMAAWTLREPVGVVAAIVPWNSPLVLTAMKLAPALAAGCCVVLKPAEDTSITALRMAQLIEQAGLPAGVLNVVTGRGAVAGALLAAHPQVDKVAFTGSTATGRAILDASRGNLKRVTLELGGKSPVIVLPDADLDLAIPGAANAIFFNAGQVCVAGSRTYVHASIYDRVLEGLAQQASGLQLGHGLNPATQMGPLVSMRQAERVEAFVDEARRDGASIVTGGERVGEAGTFIRPAVVADVRPDMTIVREEVFGPVLVVQRFDDVADVVTAANDSVYGLAASIWTESLSHAHRLSRAIQAGTVWINCHSMYDASLPIGGVKQSGYGRDSGLAAMDNYLEWKTVCAVI